MRGSWTEYDGLLEGIWSTRNILKLDQGGREVAPLGRAPIVCTHSGGCNKALLEVAENGKTKVCGALHAAGWGQVDVFRALLAAGAQVDCEGSAGKRSR
eukprot:2457153-Pyramimonas_sp.AAC.1